MRPFTYVRASDPAQAAALAVAEPDTTYLAGGTNLIDLMKLGVARPARLVDITELPFDRIQHRPDGGALVGATVRNADLAGDIGIRQRFPMLSEAVLAGASGQLRSAATTGGNLLQRTRCVYFQDITKPCNKRTPGAGCSAIEGHHRDLAVLGTSDSCVATHPSDMVVGLAALDAVVHVRRAGGAQAAIPLGAFYRLPGDTPDRETVLEGGDLITAVELPPPPPGAVMRYRKIRDRASYAFAVVSVAAVVAADADKRLRDVRIALGGVAPVPWRARRIERALVGQRPDEETLRAAGEDEFSSATPLPHNAFKIGLAVDVVSTTVLDLLEAV
ncbi:xanthine dehydrogenase family protein subunit M [Pseudonocardia sp. DSM 110487]|uniref:FAD binding domain-containing protein n=1 Tax=Pseudonocardia sp. DSM 110487 TaxID=2865833 RepID=UPI001C6951E9|nr:xanthine dehydrogenase family protein subunit M [Pseudonocardia sp. DSM 110487]QYN38860.1 xanthine dehydrogenase family protein subunit M [Pseudonocardia sp. DSM 110487]